MNTKIVLRLIRFPNLLITFVILLLIFFGLVRPALVKAPEFNDYLLLGLVILNTLVIMSAGNIYNDLRDTFTDQFNKPHKLIIGKYLSDHKARRWYLILSILALILSILLLWYTGSFFLFFLYIISMLTLHYYSKNTKARPWLGNFMIAFLCAMIFPLVPSAFSYRMEIAWWTNQDILFPVMTFGIFAFVTTLIRELVKDLEDMKGDQIAGMRTIPLTWRESSIQFYGSTLFGLVLVLLLLTGFSWADRLSVAGLIYTAGLILSTLLSAVKFRRACHHQEYRQLSSWLKVYILQGILLLIFWL